MRGFVLAGSLLLFGCEPAATVQQFPSAPIGVDTNPRSQEPSPKVPEIPIRVLSRKQRKELDSTLPLKIREVLEKAQTLEVLGLSSEERVGIGWHPDISVSLPANPQRTQLLQAFYFDASAGPNPSACFLPRHGLKATYNGKTIEVIICFQCHLFAIRGDLGEFDGGVYLNGSASHHLFEQILQEERTKMGVKSSSVSGT